jgi:peptide/nickel transport system ATP-binding protein
LALLSVADLAVHYATRSGTLRAVDGVSFDVEAGETVGIVGESGCGKSTLARAVLRLETPASGRISFDGTDIAGLSPGALRPFRRRAQMVFQDPYASLNPRQTIRNILLAPLATHGVGTAAERDAHAASMIEKVGLTRQALALYPHEFSGGQRQRIGIARALMLQPALVVCDEPVSALDLSIQAQILNLLAGMKRDFGLTYLFISHDLSVVRYFSDRTMVMYLGRVVETAPSASLWSAPRHPYTRALIAAIPEGSRARRAPELHGDIPSARDIPAGCRFHPRCAIATSQCRTVDPPVTTDAAGHEVACHHPA